MFAQLGNIRFELLGPTAMDDTARWNYTRHQVMDEKPVLQYIGQDLNEINLKLAFHRSFCDPSIKLKELKDAANSDEPLTLLWGNGEIAGDFVIEEISRAFENMDEIGNIIAIAVDVRLVEYSEARNVMAQRRPLRVINTPKIKNTTVKPDIPKENYPLENVVRQA